MTRESRESVTAILLLLAGCASGGADETVEGRITFGDLRIVADAPVADAPIVAAMPEEAPGPDGVREEPDLQVQVFPDDHISVMGTDRWGEPIDIVFESRKYFEDALPVLERMVSPEAARALQLAAAEGRQEQ